MILDILAWSVLQFKVVEKILAKRLSLVLHDVIGIEKSAFLMGKRILDGLLMVNEIVSWIKKRRILWSLRWILRKRVIRLVGIIWIKLWVFWVLEIDGDPGVEVCSRMLELWFLIMGNRHMNSNCLKCWDRGSYLAFSIYYFLWRSSCSNGRCGSGHVSWYIFGFY